MRYYFEPKQVKDGEFKWTVSTSNGPEEHIKMEGRMPSETLMFDVWDLPFKRYSLYIKFEGMWGYIAMYNLPDEIKVFLLVNGIPI